MALSGGDAAHCGLPTVEGERHVLRVCLRATRSSFGLPFFLPAFSQRGETRRRFPRLSTAHYPMIVWTQVVKRPALSTTTQRPMHFACANFQVARANVEPPSSSSLQRALQVPQTYGNSTPPATRDFAHSAGRRTIYGENDAASRALPGDSRRDLEHRYFDRNATGDD